MRNIENLEIEDEIIKEIRKQNEVFDLFDFYLQNEDCDDILQAGFEIITPNQSFDCYSLGRHEYLIESIYSVMYSDFYDVLNESDYDWHQASATLGNICIQLLSKRFTFVWLPEKINKYQFSKLFEFYDSMRRINDYFSLKNKPTIVFACDCSDGKHLFHQLTLEECIFYMSNRISDDICVRDEKIIVAKSSNTKKKLLKRQLNHFNK